MPIITGADSEFGRLVIEEFNRRAQRVVALGQAAPDADIDEGAAGTGEGDQEDEGPPLLSCGPGVPSQNGAAHLADIPDEELERSRDGRVRDGSLRRTLLIGLETPS
jgi:hypothetical protein